jgi:flavin-dependent dehydrogenase
MEKHDVIVVGAGPAGAACAKALKENGIDVLVIEKEGLPRHKTCSGVLFGQTQVLLERYFGGLPPEDIYCEPTIIQASKIHEWSAEKGLVPYTWEIPKDGESFPEDYYNTWRNRFDYWLLQQAGAEYRDNCTLRNFSVQDDMIALEVSEKEKGTAHLACSYLIGADGSHSRLRMVLDPTWVTDATTVGVYQTYQRFSDMGLLQDGHWSVFFEKELGDFLSCVHRTDDCLALCVNGFKGRHLKEGMEKFKAFLAKHFRVVFGDMMRDEGCDVRLSPPHLGTGNVLLVGEAASFLYLNGEGISAALDSGYQAGMALAHSLTEGANALDLYTEQCQGIIKHLQSCREQMHFMIE